MKRWLSLALIFLLACPPLITWADELDDTTTTLTQKQADLKKAQQDLAAAKNKESQLSGTLGGLQQSLNIALAEINVKQAEVNTTLAELDRQAALLRTQETNRSQRVRSLYKQLKRDNGTSLISLLDTANIAAITKMVSYFTSALHDDKARIVTLDQQINQLSQQRDALQKQAADINSRKVALQNQANTIKAQISIVQSQKQGANNQIVSLGNDIKGLTARQQQLVQAKIAANAARSTVGDKETVSTPLPAPGFDNAFAFASYGYPHRVGMSQYGAKGRAEAGQNYQTILTTYYASTAVGSYAVPATITVNGYSPEYGQTFNNETFPFEEYLKHLYEMPASWPMEALKAQAVAARTYAVKWLNDHPGQAICPSQSCQVVKHELNATNWQQAVDATAGIVVTYSGVPISTWYSSTVGGYTQSSAQIWGGSTAYTHVVKDYAGSWPAGAYDKDSPWFHKAWGSRTGSGYNPWMTKDETLDLFNAALLYDQTGKTSDTDFDLSPAAKGGSSPEQVVAALNSRGIQPIGDFQLITVNQNDTTGQTDAVNVLGGPRTVTKISGANVKKVFNLRSLGTLALESTLFDIITQ